MSDLNDNAETLVMQLLDTASSLEHSMDSVLANARGISFREYRLLKTLLQTNTGGLTRVALSSAVSLTPSAVTRALKPLEKLGYVATVKNERDARQSLAQLTDGGRQLLVDAENILNDFYQRLAIIPGADARERQQLLQQLERLRLHSWHR